LVCAWLGEFDVSERACLQASQLAQAQDRPYDIVAADYGRGVVELARGHLDEPEPALDHALRVSRESEVRLFLPLILSALGNLHVQKGQAAHARDMLLEAKNQADILGHAVSLVAVPAYLGAAYAQLGEVQHGLSLVRNCQAGARQKGYGGIELLATFYEANILASQGMSGRADAIDCLKRAIDLAAKLEAGPLLAAARVTLGRLFTDSGRSAEAQDELVQALALFDRSKMTVQMERTRATLSKFSDV
jgi:tetratricopeptide (TPR) repeat protein